MIARAQEIAKREGLRIGQTVAHPSDRTVYALKEIKYDIAVVWLPDQENTAKEFPLSELFDPNVAGRELAQYTSDQDHGFHLKARPG